jgi:RNA polymerase sigma-70 factor, ECF subfamily
LLKIYRSRETELAEDYQNISERELAAQATGGDEAAFAEIVRRYSPRVFRVAARFFPSYSLVEEAAQEVFLKAFVQIGKYEARGSLEGWMTRIAVTTCINLTRSNKGKRQTEFSISDLNADEADWLEEKIYNASAINHRQEEEKLIAADLVKRILAVLPPEDALVLTMMDGEGESVKDVAQMTGWSEAKVKTKAFRARKRIREILQKLLPFDAGKPADVTLKRNE